MKTCAVCEAAKPLSEFGTGRGRRRSYCGDCKPEHERRVREARRLYEQAYRRRDPEKFRAAVLASQKRHPEAVKQRKARYRRAHGEEIRAWNRAYRAANPELNRAAQARRRARKRGARLGHVDLAVIVLRDEGRCGICGGDLDGPQYHLDHIVPLAIGGEHSTSNLQLSHPACNVRKGARAEEVTP